jgi:hypothetical protein
VPRAFPKAGVFEGAGGRLDPLLLATINAVLFCNIGWPKCYCKMVLQIKVAELTFCFPNQFLMLI